jgi:hypothetical protein
MLTTHLVTAIVLGLAVGSAAWMIAKTEFSMPLQVWVSERWMAGSSIRAFVGIRPV